MHSRPRRPSRKHTARPQGTLFLLSRRSAQQCPLCATMLAATINADTSDARCAEPDSTPLEGDTPRLAPPTGTHDCASFRCALPKSSPRRSVKRTSRQSPWRPIRRYDNCRRSKAHNSILVVPCESRNPGNCGRPGPPLLGLSRDAEVTMNSVPPAWIRR